MPLSSKERSVLLAQSHQSHARVSVSPDAITEQVVERIRQALAQTPLLKVRVQTDTRAACEQAGAHLAQAIPCEFVRRVGRVLLLYQAPAPP